MHVVGRYIEDFHGQIKSSAAVAVFVVRDLCDRQV